MGLKIKIDINTKVEINADTPDAEITIGRSMLPHEGMSINVYTFKIHPSPIRITDYLYLNSIDDVSIRSKSIKISATFLHTYIHTVEFTKEIITFPEKIFLEDTLLDFINQIIDYYKENRMEFYKGNEFKNFISLK